MRKQDIYYALIENTKVSRYKDNKNQIRIGKKRLVSVEEAYSRAVDKCQTCRNRPEDSSVR